MSSQSRTLRIALAQLNYTVGDLEGNVALIAEHIERARTEGADLVVFSECALLGYPPRDMVERDELIARQLAKLDEVAALSDDELGVLLGFIDKNPGEQGKTLRNAAALCHGGEVVGKVFKRLLPTYDVFDEDRYFEPGDDARTFAFKGVELGISVCEDAWNERDFWERPLYWVDPVKELAEAGAELLINIAASPFHVHKGEFRRRLLASHASSHGRTMVFVNQIGGHDELIFDGRSLVVTPDGEVSCRLAEFAEDFTVREIPVDAADAVEPPSLADISEDTATQARKAVVMGIRDYFHKSGFEGAVIGVSGGIDSALTAALAAEALGPENVLGVAMPTRYTRDMSNEDAKILADNLGIDFQTIPIEETFGAFLAQMAPAFEGYDEGIAEENIQARIRGTTLMALSNKYGKLVLVPSNKSELAVGYSTLYGDMVGALSPLGDCLKTLVYDMARSLNVEAGKEVIPGRTIERAPSAELRPDQTDQDALPPYEVLDAILEAYMNDGLSAAEIVERGFDAELVDDTLKKLFRAEYKRWQAAPVLKVTSKAFGVGWRYPLAASYADLREK
ncbi:NAD+ synthase [Persicimonas caeni]|uniref:Glutamine-dependent NAD(+) synthetase n=1 Tax=Persicimonas caeni TaxID=2292766 RepID=A0A4Y6PU02_PERCE|nr:NAD+ synthase [Persicimonas caeni]QDG51778.1 NAD+ synthase [Persicimonas caeni]QED32999.1 NAD+ synthase [Persicimonas caeni]